MEVYCCFAECAADTLVQCQCRLQDLVAQLLDVLLELLEVALLVTMQQDACDCTVAELSGCLSHARALQVSSQHARLQGSAL